MAMTVSTKDTQLGAFLLARGHRVVGTTRSGSSTYFYFDDSPGLTADVESLRFGDDLVSARKLSEARTYLLTLIHDAGVTR